MKQLSHKSAKPSHYSKEAKHYDAFNEQNSRLTNQTIENILKKYHVKTVLDLTCGTGSQVLWLAQRGYEVVGADINANMLKMARHKARTAKLKVKLLKGDMRTLQVGKFDAVITIFNAIGHLTKKDYAKAMRNIYKNLKEDGIYVFDIFNLNYLMKDNNITRLTIDWQKISDNKKIRDIQYSTIDHNGILASYTTSYVQNGVGKPKISHCAQTLQVYTAQQLKDMLYKNGFKAIHYYEIDGSKFSEYKSERIVMIAKKLAK